MIVKLSPAKVNLHLRVLARRADGFHNICTLMQRIDLCDEMTFTRAERGINLRCPGSTVPEDNKNIAYRAADALLSRLPDPPGISITIKKRIPVAAGLGGGSSNAATTLIAINEMMGLHLGVHDLMETGKRLGADVPFFIFGKTAWATGIGECLHAAQNIPQLWYVLVNPGFEISTRSVYEGLNLRLTKRAVNYKCPQLRSINGIIKSLRNDLERVTLNLHPVLQHFKNLLVQHGAEGALMTGSGPTVMGIFRDEEGAIGAEQALKNAGAGEWPVYRASSI
ncbi:MAG TPA: 4-(cytidine 5'-diphospho)-2-C-methyl-D-erythritol kinase [Syntrophales bacterium]|nr:4-(cytidine 5'-diphospho)-2-C-methyl-D-erythritol kinase [Syntrophales bacterium]